jgi:hypothetical protein
VVVCHVCITFMLFIGFWSEGHTESEQYSDSVGEI